MKQRMFSTIGLSALAVIALISIAPLHAQEKYEPGSVLVVAPKDYPFAGVEIAGAVVGGEAVDLPFVQAAKIAKTDPNVVGIVSVDLSADSLIERGRVACYSKTGEKRWEERVLFNMGGNADRIAEKYASRLAKKVKGKRCS